MTVYLDQYKKRIDIDFYNEKLKGKIIEKIETKQKDECTATDYLLIITFTDKTTITLEAEDNYHCPASLETEIDLIDDELNGND